MTRLRKIIAAARTPIALILICALALRLWGIWFGFPLFLVNDEPAFVLGALTMLQLKTLVPAWHIAAFQKVLGYPPVLAYFYLVVLSPVLAVNYMLSGFPLLGVYQDAFAINPSFLWIAARIVNVLLGIVLIAVVYRLAKRITASERASLFAALFLSVSFYHLQLSQVVRHWMPAALLVYAAWLAAISIREKGTRISYVRAGVLAGVATAINTSAVIAFLPIFLAHFARPADMWTKKLRSSDLWLALAIAAAIVALSIALYPYGFTRAEGAGSVGGDVKMRFGFLASKSFSEWFSFLASYVKLALRYETTLILGALLGTAAMIRRSKLFLTTAALFGFFYFSLLYLFFNGIPRALLFILPALAIMAGLGVDRLMLRLQNSLRATVLNLFFIPAAIVFVFFAYPLAIDLRYDYLLTKPDTRLEARNWISEHIPAGTKILGDTSYLRLTNTKAGVRELERIDPSGLRAADRALARLPDAQYPSPAYDFLNLHFVSAAAPARSVTRATYFRALGYRYVVVEYRYRDQSDLDPHTRAVINGLSLVSRFMPFGDAARFSTSLDISGEIATVNPLQLFQFDRFGQFVDIYRL